MSPIFRKDIYVGVFGHLPKYDSPLDFFDPDYNRFPQAMKNIFIPAVLEAGDCIYVPAYYYVQSRTLPVNGRSSDTIMITQEYAPHSRFVDLMLDAAEQDLLTDEMAEIDAKMLDFYNVLKPLEMDPEDDE